MRRIRPSRYVDVNQADRPSRWIRGQAANAPITCSCSACPGTAQQRHQPGQPRLGDTACVAVELEFWPEYNSGPLWDGGTTVDLGSLGLSQDLRARLIRWNAKYSDDLLPFESNDVAWLAEGRTLLGQLRFELGDTHSIVVHEPWWGEEPTD